MLINITVPVYNEEHDLPRSIAELDDFARDRMGGRYEIVIADNASTDSTPAVAHRLAAERECVRVYQLSKKGRGRALKAVWMSSKADILSYMDVDLSTDITAFPTLVGALLSGDYDIAAGSRLLQPSLTERGWKREFISRCYNVLVKAMFQTRFSDAQCGFKAITRYTARELLPVIEDGCWFFDTELMVVAEKSGHRICDLPVRWTDDSDSRVNILKTALADIKGLIRLRRNLVSGRYEAVASSRTKVYPGQCEKRISRVRFTNSS